MIVVIQDAAGRQPHAGHMKTRDGRRVLFVADPRQAPDTEGTCYARPDALSNFGAPWRSLVRGYNANPRNNPLGLLPAHSFYPDEIYARLATELAPAGTYILSPAWGIVKATFLMPNYDISLSPDAEPYRRRKPTDNLADFCMLPNDGGEDLYFFGAAEYVPLFCKLTSAYLGRRVVYCHSANPPEAPGCETRSYASENPADWHRECAKLVRTAQSRPGKRTPVRKVSNLEARLKALTKSADGTSPRSGSGAGSQDQAIRAAIGRARHEIAEYQWLVRALQRVDVREDEEFQQRYAAHHHIAQRSGDWYIAYYRLLETAKVIGAEFVDILDELWQETGRYEPAYASRLVATVDPGKPIWDRIALMHAGLRAPAYPDPDKLDKATAIYRQIREWYATYLESPDGKRILEVFDEEVPDHQGTDALKKLEFVLREMRIEHPALAAGGTGMSLRQPA